MSRNFIAYPNAKVSPGDLGVKLRVETKLRVYRKAKVPPGGFRGESQRNTGILQVIRMPKSPLGDLGVSPGNVTARNLGVSPPWGI